MGPTGSTISWGTCSATGSMTGGAEIISPVAWREVTSCAGTVSASGAAMWTAGASSTTGTCCQSQTSSATGAVSNGATGSGAGAVSYTHLTLPTIYSV